MCAGQDEGSIEAEAFLQELHDALSHLRDLPVRRSHPLCRHFASASPISTTKLQKTLFDAIEQLRPPSEVRSDSSRLRRYRYLKLRYAEGARVEDVVAALGISGRQARREHRLALQELGALLLRDSTTEQLPSNVAGEMGTDDISAPDPATPSALELELTHIEITPELEPLDLQTAIDDALGLVSHLAASRSVVIEHVPSAALPRVIATRTVLRQILLSVLSYFVNSGSTRRLRIITSETPAGVELHFLPVASPEVSPPSGVTQVFDRLPPSLEAACRLAEGQEGLIKIEPTDCGVAGVRLLLLTPQATLVLVVDDNPSLVRLFRRFVRGAGYRLVQARNSIRAYELARALHPNVIILDLMMPVQDGWDLLQSLQQDPTTTQIPVVACSILPERDLALSLGTRDFLAKPVTPTSLLDALEPFRRGELAHQQLGADDGVHPDLP